jgi:hypothetical protein
MKRFQVLTFFVIFFLICLTFSSYAEITYKSILVEYRGIKINVNGKRINPDVEPFIYSGRTFVPIRAVSESLNKDVKWNDATNTIDINDKTTNNKEPGTQDVTVYITKTGSKYHRDGCRYLSKSKIAITLKQAKDSGYTPCSVCKPPE